MTSASARVAVSLGANLLLLRPDTTPSSRKASTAPLPQAGIAPSSAKFVLYSEAGHL